MTEKKENFRPKPDCLRFSVFLSIFSLYLILRLVAWKHAFTLGEDSDSVGYLYTIKAFLRFDLDKIIDLSPTITPFYPFFSAVLSLPTRSPEIGARLCSLLFSSLLFLSVFKIGKRIGNQTGVAAGLLILSFSTVLIPLSYGVLTESSYIATIYLGMWVFWTQFEHPDMGKAALLGCIFGLSFLNRTEGILYIAIIPFFQTVHLVVSRRRQYGVRRFAGWALVYLACFSVIVAPQIWRVSKKMGRFAINGRQVWSLVLNNPDGKSYDEKIHGLDYSPSLVNIDYLQIHPEAMKGYGRDHIDVRRYARNFMDEFKSLYQKQLGVLIGPFGFMCFAFGLIALYEAEKQFDLFLILAFIGLNLVPPLLHNVVVRHIAVIAPIMMLVEGIGIVHISHRLLASRNLYPKGRYVLPALLLAVLIGASAFVLRDETLDPPKSHFAYSPKDLEPSAEIIKNFSIQHSKRSPVIVAQWPFLAYYSNGIPVRLPFTDYEGLVKYCYLNHVDFLYLHYGTVKNHPFLVAFREKNHDGKFELLYRGTDSFFHENIE